MKTIRKKIIVLGVFIGIGLIAFLCFLIQESNPTTLHREAGLLFTMLLDVVLVLFFIKSVHNCKLAKLITENQILHIQSGKTENLISCFGILINGKVIKFNLDRIHLINIEIGERYIEMTYGTNKKIDKTRISHDQLSSDELEDITTKFRYETGITPVVLRERKEGI